MKIINNLTLVAIFLFLYTSYAAPLNTIGKEEKIIFKSYFLWFFPCAEIKINIKKIDRNEFYSIIRKNKFSWFTKFESEMEPSVRRGFLFEDDEYLMLESTIAGVSNYNGKVRAILNMNSNALIYSDYDINDGTNFKYSYSLFGVRGSLHTKRIIRRKSLTYYLKSNNLYQNEEIFGIANQNENLHNIISLLYILLNDNNPTHIQIELLKKVKRAKVSKENIGTTIKKIVVTIKDHEFLRLKFKKSIDEWKLYSINFGEHKFFIRKGLRH